MANISEYLQKIMFARYGKDVRQSIHDAIETCYHDGKAGSIDLQVRQKLGETDISSIGDGTVTGGIKDVSDKADANESNISTLSSKVTKNEGDITSLSDKVEQHDSDITELTDKVEQHDSDISTLNSNLNNCSYIGGSMNLSYQSSNQIGGTVAITLPTNFNRCLGIIATINYSSGTASAVQKVDRICPWLENINNNKQIAIFAYSDDNDFISSDIVSISWLMVYI